METKGTEQKENKTSTKWNDKLKGYLYDNNCPCATFLGTLENNTGIERTKLVIIVGALLALYLMVGYGREFICNLIGFAYPAYVSIKAIESVDKEDDTKWLIYWVVFGCFTVVESLTDLFLSWVPFYYLIKCAFLILCMSPTPWNGSLFIYKTIIRPFFLKHEQKIDSGFAYASKIGKEMLDEAGQAAASVAIQSLSTAAPDGQDTKKDE